MRLDHLLSKGFPLIVFLWVRGVARCRVLGRCALGRTPLPQGIVWGGVGGLVVNCIVDASIYNM